MGQRDKLSKMEQLIEFYDEEPEPSEDQDVIPVLLPQQIMARLQVYTYFNPRIVRC